MAETFATAMVRLRDLVAAQVDGYRRLLDSTHEGNDALRAQDMDGFDRVLAEQMETLRELKELEQERRKTLQDVGPAKGHTEIDRLTSDLRELAREVSRASRVGRLVIERNGALVEARLALHRRAATSRSTSAVDRIA